MQQSPKIILGIDPGTLVMGYSIIAVNGQHICLREMSVLKLNARLDNYRRLQLIYQKIAELVDKYHPQCFAIEAPFFGKNVQSMLKLGRAQGVAIAAAMHAGISIYEYSPKKVKQAVTGNGNADKQQVWKMLQRLLALQEADLKFLDASDALAVAVCHHFQDKNPINNPIAKIKGWEEFIKANPGRIR